MGDLYSEVRKLINHQTAIFNGGDAHAHLMKACDDAFTVLEENAEELEDEGITDELSDFIEHGICLISRNFENGKPIGPNVMNVLIRAVRLYNNASSRPFQLNRECHLTTLEGMLFLSNTVLDIVHSPDLQFFPQDYPPWQLHIEPRPRPRPASIFKSEEPLARMPSVIVIHAHGSMPVKTGAEENPKLPFFKFPFEGRAFGPSEQPVIVSSRNYRKNMVVEFETPVDVFTTAKFGRPLHWFMADDPPQIIFAENLLEMAKSGSIVERGAFREMVKRALCKMRDEYIQDEKSTMTTNLTRAGNEMADLLLFRGNGAATVEGIISIDSQTGSIEHLTPRFGLVSKEERGHVLREYPKSEQQPSEYRIDTFGNAKAHAESELKAKGSNMDDYKMYALHKHIKNLDLGIRGMNRESEFEFSDEMKQIYGDEIRLSTLLQIGINSGSIHPTDIVVVLSCRTAEKQLPIGSKSPRRDDESESEGGGRKSKKHKLLKKTKKRNRCKMQRITKKSKKH